MKNFFIPSFLLFVFLLVSCSAPTARTVKDDGPAWDAQKFSRSVYAAFFPNGRGEGRAFRVTSKKDGSMTLERSTLGLSGGGMTGPDDVKQWALQNANKSEFWNAVGPMTADKSKFQLTTTSATGVKLRMTFQNQAADRGYLEQDTGEGWERVGDVAFAGRFHS